MLLSCVHQPDVTSSSRRPSPASSGGSGSSTASPPPAASMGTTASSKLGPAQARTTARSGRSGSPTAARSIESASQNKLVDTDGSGSYMKDMHLDMTIFMMLTMMREYQEENEAILAAFTTASATFWESNMAAHFQTFLTTVPIANGGANMLDPDKLNDITSPLRQPC
ncbi:hypothetical protein PR003_g28177 [Phytophthora rubi]|uniref:Uncharacterized protein n=1 Tax=Phytophthora rubi TaxID=129364 RepID=A0A6A4BTZ0_9STRA|nr:hypothetical protein PR003_g28177 [Phytophthora rubi]